MPFCPQGEGRKEIAKQEENCLLIVDRMARPKESWENVGHHYRVARGLESTSHAGKEQRAGYRALGVTLHSSGALWGACVLERADHRACIHAVQVYKIQTWLFSAEAPAPKVAETPGPNFYCCALCLIDHCPQSFLQSPPSHLTQDFTLALPPFQNVFFPES